MFIFYINGQYINILILTENAGKQLGLSINENLKQRF